MEVIAALLALSILAAKGDTPEHHRHMVRDNQQWTMEMQAANAAIQKNQLEVAVIRFRAALAAADPLEKEDPRGVGSTCWSLGNALHSVGKDAEAEKLYSRALTLEERAPDADEVQLSEHFRALGNFYMSKEKWDKAEAVYDRALEHAKISQGEVGADPDWKDRGADEIALATAQLKGGKFADSETNFEHAKASYEKAPGGIATDEDRRFILRALLGEADSFTGLKKFDKAEPLYEKVLSLGEKAFGRKDPGLASACDAYAKMLRASKRADDAKKYEERAKEIRTPEKQPF